MKKFKMLLILMGAVLLISGCDEQPIQSPTPQNNEKIQSDTSKGSTESDSSEDVKTETSEEKEDAKKVVSSSVISDDVLQWNKVSGYSGDVDGDGADEEIILATSAECDENGNFIWNDGQNWALYVLGSDEDYLLFKEYINIGKPYFEISDYYMEDEVKSQINFVVSSGAGFSLRSYSFSADADGYVEEIIYNTKDITEGGINTKFSSFPAYQKNAQ